MSRKIHEFIDSLKAPGLRKQGIGTQMPADIGVLRSTFSEFGREVPQDILAFYSRCNGINFGQFEVMSTAETFWMSPDLLVVHQWGNGDFDCAQIVDGKSNSPIFFVGHDQKLFFQVSPSLVDWLCACHSEYIKHGDILDPLSALQTDKSLLYARGL